MALDRSDFTIDSGFKVLAKEAIDSRMLLTKAQMLNIGLEGSEGPDHGFIPERYLAICADSDTVGLYLFDEANDWSSEGTDIGKFRWLAGMSADTLGPGFKFEDGKLELVLDPEDFVLDSEGFLHSTLTASEGIFIDPQGYISVRLDPEAFIFNSEGQISVDPDWLPFVIGNGLKIENDVFSAKIDEATIQFDPSGRLFARPITVSEGLAVTGDGFLYLRLGNKVTFDSEGNITLEDVADAFTPGDGLEIDSDVLKLVLDNDSLILSEGKLQVGDLHNKISVSEGLIFNNSDVISLNLDNDTLILSEGKLKLGSVHGILSVSEGLILSDDGVISLDLDDSLVFSEGKLSVGSLNDIISVSEGLIFENNVLSLDLDNDTIILSEGKLKLGSVHGVLFVSEGLILSSEGIISLDLDNDSLVINSEGKIAIGDLHNVFSVSDGLIFDSEDVLSLDLDKSLAFSSEGKLKIGRLDGIIKVSEGLSLDSENLLSLVLDNDTVFINSEGKVESKQFKFAVSEGFKFSSEGLLSLDLDNDTLVISEGKLSLRDLSEILSVSEGLAFDSEGTLKLVLGDNLIISEGKLTLDGVAKAFTVSEGLELTSEGILRLLLSDSLKIDSEGKLYVSLSDIVSTDGLQVGSEGKVELKIDSDKLQINSAGELTLVEQGINFKTSEGLKLSSEGWLSVKFDNDTIKLNSEGKLYAEVPAAVQSDWAETSEGEIDFIKNKPAVKKGTGNNAVVIGAGSAQGANSVAEGDGTTAYNTASHAEGRQTTAQGDYSHAEGRYTHTQAQSSHAEGDHTIAKVANQHVQGKYNADNANAVDIVGWGDSTTRKNISTLHTTGDLHLAGDVYVQSDSEGNGGVKLVNIKVSEGLDLTSEGLLSLKIDNDTIKLNSEGQLYSSGGGGSGASYIASEGISIVSDKYIKAKVDNQMIRINSEGEIYNYPWELNETENIVELNSEWSLVSKGKHNQFNYLPYSFNAKGTSGENGYARIATIKLKPGAFSVVEPFHFRIMRTFDSVPVDLYLKLVNKTDSDDPAIESFWYDDYRGKIYNYTFNAFAYHSDISTYDIYVEKPTAESYIDVYSFIPMFDQLKADIIYDEDLMTSVPSGATVAKIVPAIKLSVWGLSTNQTSGNCITAGKDIYRSGNVCQLSLGFTTTSVISPGGTIFEGTISGMPRPLCPACGVDYYSDETHHTFNSIIVTHITTSGYISVKLFGSESLPDGATGYILATYLTND